MLLLLLVVVVVVVGLLLLLLLLLLLVVVLLSSLVGSGRELLYRDPSVNVLEVRLFLLPLVQDDENTTRCRAWLLR